MDTTGMTAEEQVQDYLRRAGVQTVSSGLHTEEHPSKGFMTYIVAGDELFVPDIYGDGRHWERRARELAKAFGVSKITGATRTEKIDAYCRLFRCRAVGYLIEKEVD